jgi:hypothetical protein
MDFTTGCVYVMQIGITWDHNHCTPMDGSILLSILMYTVQRHWACTPRQPKRHPHWTDLYVVAERPWHFLVPRLTSHYMAVVDWHDSVTEDTCGTASESGHGS